MAKTSKQLYKDFFKEKGFYLLRSPHSRYMVGDLASIEKRFFLNIDNESIIDELPELDKETRQQYRSFVKDLPKVPANLPSIAVEKELAINLEASLPIPANLNKPALGIGQAALQHFEFSNVKARVLDNNNPFELRKIIDDTVDGLRGQKKRALKREVGRFKKALIIEELFYADTVEIEMQRGFSLNASAEASLAGIDGVELKASLGSAGSKRYSFTGNSEVPFAAKVIALAEL